MTKIHLAILLMLPPTMVGWSQEPSSPRVDFSRQVRPILSDKCFKCHGPDENARKSDLRLDLAEDAGEVLSRDNPAESELLRRIISTDADEQMPPPKSKLTLTPTEREVIRRWIAQGADFAQHWAFQPVRRPPLPQVKNRTWPVNPIDFFILPRLEAAGLQPAAPAAREALIRRVSFDLTGLPPTLAEIDDYLSDSTPQAYEKIVDRFLNKEQYGERMAAQWLDVARYADSYGYQVDRDRYVWPWRDWVVRAYNRNLPFDQFITWQLAGDLLPNAGPDQLLATTFNRLHSQKVEGGSVPEEFRIEYVADRNHTFATGLLGLTLECARCHDHKYDPLSQREYYQLFAFFNNIDEAGLYSYFTPSVPTPTLLLYDEAQKSRLKQLDQQLAAAETSLQQSRTNAKTFQTWLANRTSAPETLIPGREAHHSFEDHQGGANASVPGKVGKAIRLSGDDEHKLKVGNYPRHQPFSVSFWMQTPDVKKRAVVFHRSRAWTDAASRGYELLLVEGRLQWSLIHFWPGNAISIRTSDPVAIKKWVHVAVTYDGSSSATGLQIYLNGNPAETEIVRDNLYKHITGGGGDQITIGARFRDRGFTNGLVDEFDVYRRRLTDIEVAHLYDGSRLTQLIAKPVDQLSDADRSQLRPYFLATIESADQQQRAKVATAREQRNKLVDGVKEIMVMREMAKRRPTHLLKRGAYDAPGEIVEPKPPAVFPSLPVGRPADRLALAHWLTDPSHPLTSRVAVNRLWQLCLGHGLVRTPEDFGSQGQPPTHPELLDWLAGDFMDHGWDVKRSLKQILMSATYRQSARAEAATLSKDPTNRLWGRTSRYRWSAEMLRDNALYVSGLLSSKIGGPPAKPYEVTLSFKPVGRDKGEGIYRRSVYTFWKRTAPAPVMMSLDASKREVCVAKRERTSSPLQALVMLNDTQFVEAARVLAQRLLEKHQDNLKASLVDAFRLLTSRRPSDAEYRILSDLYQKQLRYFEIHPDRGRQFLKVGDAPAGKNIAENQQAALGVVISTLMNYDECAIKP